MKTKSPFGFVKRTTIVLLTTTATAILFSACSSSPQTLPERTETTWQALPSEARRQELMTQYSKCIFRFYALGHLIPSEKEIENCLTGRMTPRETMAMKNRAKEMDKEIARIMRAPE